MKKLLVLCAGMMLFASAGMAQTKGLQVGWNNCTNATVPVPSSPSITFSCDPTAGDLYSQYYSFTLAAPAAGIIAMDNIIDFIFPGNDVSQLPFWQFQSGACNNAGVSISGVRPTGFCAGNGTLLCGTGASGCPGVVITAYGYGPLIGFTPDRARMLVTLARSAASPVTITATRQWAFVLTYFMDLAPDGAGGGCNGCNAPVGQTWNNGILYDTAAQGVGGEAAAVVLSSTDPGSSPSIGTNCTSCVTVGSRTKSWGQLKSLYR